MGGMYKIQEHIHRGMLIHDYQQFRLHEGELQPSIRTEPSFWDFLHLAVSVHIVLGIVVRVQPWA